MRVALSTPLPLRLVRELRVSEILSTYSYLSFILYELSTSLSDCNRSRAGSIAGRSLRGRGGHSYLYESRSQPLLGYVSSQMRDHIFYARTMRLPRAPLSHRQRRTKRCDIAALRGPRPPRRTDTAPAGLRQRSVTLHCYFITGKYFLDKNLLYTASIYSYKKSL